MLSYKDDGDEILKLFKEIQDIYHCIDTDESSDFDTDYINREIKALTFDSEQRFMSYDSIASNFDYTYEPNGIDCSLYE